jgi:HSP20 family protein
MSNETIMKRDDNQHVTKEARVRMVSPACDVYEDGKEFLILAEMPGVDEKTVDLRLDRTRLTIEATRPLPGSTDAEAGRGSIRYTRAFEVPDTIDAAKIGASLDNGVLSIRLPKAPQARVRQIRVTAG